LLKLQEFAVQEMREGAIVKDVFSAITAKIKEEKPELEKYLVKTLGFSVS